MSFPLDSPLLTQTEEDADPFGSIPWESEGRTGDLGIPSTEMSLLASDLSAHDLNLGSFGIFDDWDSRRGRGESGSSDGHAVGECPRSQEAIQPRKFIVKWENFVTSLGRGVKKAIKICEEAKEKGIEATIKKYTKLHKQRKGGIANVPIVIDEKSEGPLLELFSKYLEIAPNHEIAEFAESHTGPSKTDGHSRKAKAFTRPAEKTWNFCFQKKFYENPALRKFYYFFIQFLDHFGAEGEGVQLSRALSLEKFDPLSVKKGLLFEYISGLKLEPFDGNIFGPVFLVYK